MVVCLFLFKEVFFLWADCSLCGGVVVGGGGGKRASLTDSFVSLQRRDPVGV